MFPASEDQLYTIGDAVAELQETSPDISHSSLRFLQREGLVQPRRTPGGHRLYSSQDLARVRLIKRWQALRLSLAEIRQRLEGADAAANPSQLVERFLDQASSGDVTAATQAILVADELGMSLTDMFNEVLRPALVEVGNRWASDDLTVAQEHEIAELCRDVMAQLILRHAAPDPQSPVVVAACVAGELHDLGLLMVCGVLRERGAKIHYLGANVPRDFLLESVRRRDPDIVLLSITIEDHRPTLDETVNALIDARQESDRPVIVAAGKPEADRARRHGVMNLSPDLSLKTMVDIICAAPYIDETS